MRKILFVIVIAALTSATAMAANTKIEREINELRSQIVNAIKEKDRKFLEGRFVDEFTHTHASGKVDDKNARLAAFVGSDETIDSIKPQSVSIKAFGRDLAVAQGRTITGGSAPKMYQWTVVYRKTGGVWRVLLSHASPVVE